MMNGTELRSFTQFQLSLMIWTDLSSFTVYENKLENHSI